MGVHSNEESVGNPLPEWKKSDTAAINLLFVGELNKSFEGILSKTILKNCFTLS